MIQNELATKAVPSAAAGRKVIRQTRAYDAKTSSTIVNAHGRRKPISTRFGSAWLLAAAFLVAAFAVPRSLAARPAQEPPQAQQSVTIHGRVLDRSGRAVGDASVHLDPAESSAGKETSTDATGAFSFSVTSGLRYLLSADKAGARSSTTSITASPSVEQQQFDLIVDSKGAAGALPNPATLMEFSDKPNFTVAGVVDWTAVGGHGSDATLRTSEALSRETLALKPETEGHAAVTPTTQAESELRAAVAKSPESFEANHRLGEYYLQAGQPRQALPLLQAAFKIAPANRENEYELASAYKESGDNAHARELVTALLAHHPNADTYRLSAEIDEKLGDPLAAVHEFEKAALLEPSEQNYFEWGSELLLHRAVWQAKDVFEKGVTAYPKSARMLAALGTALFAGARYDEAAAQLCAASDLDPSNTEPYIFMGKAEMAAPAPLNCIEDRLKRFAAQQPNNSLANYFYAMAILKRHEQSPDPQALQQAETLFINAVKIDSKCGDGYLQLGILSSSRRDLAKAADYYSKAIEADPQLGDAHYRLAVTYDRLGETAKAKREFELHDEIEKQQAAAVEQQRRDVKQFLVVLGDHTSSPQSR